MENTLIIFYVASAVFTLLFLINLISLPPKPLIGRGLVTYKSLGIFFRNNNIFIFFILIFLYGISIAPLHLLINLYYNEIGAPNSLMGIAFIIQAGCEIPFFIFGAKMVKKTSAEFILLLAMAISMLRMVLYGFISIPQIAIFVGLLHGFTISFFLVGAVEYVQSHTPPHLRTTGQSLIWAFHFGAGLTVGYTVVGYLKDVVGMRHAMHIAAMFSLVILVITYIFFKKKSNIVFLGNNAQ
jgi:MFS transporter, PPP family, 3-phenylpropionic acid transporter